MIKLEYDKVKIREGVAAGKYDKRGLTFSENIPGKKYPSKLMFIRLIENFNKKEFKDLKGTADIWSNDDNINGVVKIHVELTYKPRRLSRKRSKKT